MSLAGAATERAAPSPLLASASVALGALCLSASGIFVRLAGVEAATTAFLRCAIALLVLVPLAVAEARRRRRLTRAGTGWAVVAGVALGADYSSWAASVYAVGAGIATVLINVQVIALPALARAVDGERVSRRFLVAAPPMLLGVALVGGLGTGATASAPEPLRGTVLGVAAGLGYSVYLFLTRRGSSRDPGLVLQPLAWATAGAAATAAALSSLTTGLDLVGIPAASWASLVALALLGQVVSWLLIHRASPHLAPSATGALLLLQPVLALGLAALVLAERLTWLQAAGVVLVLAAVAHANRLLPHRRPAPPR